MRRKLALAGAAAAAILIVWRRLLLDGSVPVDGNMLALSFPHWSYARSLWAEPRLPLWNPLRHMGEPLLADPQTMLGYPPMWLLSALPDFVDFLRLWVVGHTLLAAGFAAALARRWHPRGGAWLVAAAVAGLNGALTSRVTIPNMFAAAAWIPALLYWQDRRSSVGLGVCMALAWLAGYPPIALLAGAAVVFLASLQGRPELRTLGLGLLLALALSSFQFFPFLEALANSSRGVLLEASAAGQYAMSLAELAKVLLAPLWSWWAPQFEGDPAIKGFYVGPAALVLAGIGALRGGRREGALAAAVLACLLLSLGPRLPDNVWAAPLRLFRFPAHFLVLAAHLAALLATAGAAALGRRGALLGLLVMVDLALFAQPARTAWSRHELFTEAPALAGGEGRVYHEARLMEAWQSQTLDTESDFVAMREFVAPSFGTAFGAAEVRSYQVLRPARAREFIDRLEREGLPESLLDLAGIGTVVRLEPGAARAGLGTLQVLRRPPGARARVVGRGRLEEARWRPGSVAAVVEAEEPSLFVVSESFYPGWRARIGGRTASIEPFEGTFLSVRVPAGRHFVELSYLPAAFLVGAGVSGLTLAGLLFAAVRRRPNDGEH